MEPPEFVTLRSARLDGDGFKYSATDQQGFVKWSDVLWIEFASIPVSASEEFQPGLFVDLVTYEPWLLMRIPSEKFDFTATGLPILPARRPNLIALAVELASRANEARLGPGLQWMESESPPREHRVPSQAIYRGMLRWQLTRLFLE
jgi:hypothetical protein